LRQARDEVEAALSQRVAAEQASAASETRYRRLFEAAKNGILILEADNARITDANPSLCAFLGYEAGEIRGRELWEIGIFPDAPTGAEAMGKVRDQGEVRLENLQLCARDGRRLVVDFVASSYQVDHDKVIQCDIRDVTSRTRAEQELLKSEEQCRTIVNNMVSGQVSSGRDVFSRNAQ
jgi:PAS domain S-box-containing protein